MKHFLLIYDTALDYLERRPAFRSAHLAHANAAVARGELILGGALADPADGAILLFLGETSDVARSFALQDPYVLNGLVNDWQVRDWTTVVGKEATVKIL